jgi:hypothetical protein
VRGALVLVSNLGDRSVEADYVVSEVRGRFEVIGDGVFERVGP